MKASWLKAILGWVFLIVSAEAGFCQGLVEMGNTVGTRFLTNSVAIGGGSGSANRTNGPFRYEVITAPSTITTVDASLQNLLFAPWSDTGLMGTNSPIIGRERGVGNAVNFWPTGRANAFVIVGWSMNLGDTWSDIAAGLAGASLVPKNGGFEWEGGGLASKDGQPAWFGATSIGYIMAGGPAEPVELPIFPLFGTEPVSWGVPITTTTELWIVAPEPSVPAVAVLGFAALVAARARRKLR